MATQSSTPGATPGATIRPPSAPLLDQEAALPVIASAAPPESPVSPESPVADLLDDDDIADPTVPGPLKTAVQAPGSPQEPSSAPAPSTNAPAPVAVPTPVWTEHEALLQGFCAHLLRKLDGEMRDTLRDSLRTLDAMQENFQRQWGQHPHALEALLQKLTALEQGQGVSPADDHDEVAIQAVTPQGYPVTFRLTRADSGALIDALPRVVGWLVHNNYKPV